MCLNIRSLVLHVEELKQLIGEKKPEIVFLSETRVTADIEDVEVQTPNRWIFSCAL
jgi:hypothetical protein